MTDTASPGMRRKTLQPADIALLAVAAGVLAVIAVIEPAIVSGANLTNVVRQSSFLVIFALAQMFPLLTRGLDLSQGAQIALVSVVFALLSKSFALPQAAAAAILVGATVGAVNGAVISYWKVSPFVVTLGLGSIVQGGVLILSRGQPIFDVPAGFGFLGWGSVIGIPVVCVVAGLILLATLGFLTRTVPGRCVYAVGSNPEAARISGVNVPGTLLTAYVQAAFITGCGAVLLASRVSSGSPTLGADTPLQAISAAVIGGVSLMGGRGSVIGTALGALFLGILANALNLLNLSSFIQQIVIGAVVIIAVILDRIRQSEARRSALRSLRRDVVARRKVRLTITPRLAWGGLIGMVAILVFAAFLAAGRRGADNPARPNTAVAAQAQSVLNMRTAADFPVAVPRRHYKIGVLFPIQGVPFWTNEAYGVLDEARKVGVDVVWLSAGGYQDVAGQIRQIEDLVASGVDAIMLGATSATGTVAAVEQAVSRGVKIVNHVSATASDKVAVRISDDYYAMGVRQADYIAKALDESGGLVMLSGPAAADWSTREAAGFKTRLKEKYPKLTILSEHFGNPDRLDGERVIEDALVTFPADRLKAIYTATDILALGAVDAAEKAGRISGLFVSASGFSEETIPFIRSGALSVNIDENPTVIGRVALNATVRALNDETVPTVIYVPSPAITADNIDHVDAATQWAPKDWTLR